MDVYLKRYYKKIIDFHTYDPTHNKPDIVLTPFIHVNNKQLALAPTLIITNNLARNLLKHLSKNFKDEFDKNSHVFSDNMISEFKTDMSDLFFHIHSKVKIAPDSSRLPDADICLIDDKKKRVMFCELKWTIPPAEPSEIRDKETVEKHAVEQLDLLKIYVLDNSEKVKSLLSIDFPLNTDNTYFVGVFMNHVGTAAMFNEETPIVEYRIFCALLKNKDNLEDVFDEIRSRNFLPCKDVDFKYVDQEHSIGKYKLTWTGFIDI